MHKSILLFILVITLTLSACSKDSHEVPKSVEEMLKNNGVQEIKVDLNYQNPEIPDKKYLSLTATYNFATAEGKPQKEFLGYILKLEGQDWKIDKNTTYTKNEQKAKELLGGSK